MFKKKHKHQHELNRDASTSAFTKTVIYEMRLVQPNEHGHGQRFEKQCFTDVKMLLLT